VRVFRFQTSLRYVNDVVVVYIRLCGLHGRRGSTVNSGGAFNVGGFLNSYVYICRVHLSLRFQK